MTPRRESIDPTLLTRMDKHKISEDAATEPFNVVFISAGNIMFGTPEGPWNHSFRFEHKLGPRLKIVALIDPSLERCATVLAEKRASFVEAAYRDTQSFKTIEEFIKVMEPSQAPRVVVVGCPPAYRGTDLPGQDLELLLLKYFPGVAIFIEKPVATGPVDRTFVVADALKKAQIVSSVGYMLRYLKAVQQIKQIISENNLHVMATNARYLCAYERIGNSNWWDKSIMCGPIIEQGTHFCDLSRYFGGDVDISTVQASSLEYYEPAGKLSKQSIDESKILPENRIPRVTSATWKYESGAVGSLTHAVNLQGRNYSCELEVYADGYQFKLIDPYNAPELRVRSPASDQEVVYKFPDDDPFFSEVSNMIDVIENGPESAAILSSFEDACKTYEFTWAIREASEKTRKIPEGGLPQ